MKKYATLAVLGIVIIAAVFYTARLWRGAPPTPEQPQVATSTAQDTIPTPDTSDWLTYENKEYGYRFKYPEGVEVVDGKDPKFSFYGYTHATFVVLPAKYPYLADFYFHPEDPKSWRDYTIIIGADYLGGGTALEISPDFGSVSSSLVEPVGVGDTTIAVYEGGKSVRLSQGERGGYKIGLVGVDPQEPQVSFALQKINNSQLTAWVNNYPEYLRILKGIYTTFEIFEPAGE